MDEDQFPECNLRCTRKMLIERGILDPTAQKALYNPESDKRLADFQLSMNIDTIEETEREQTRIIEYLKQNNLYVVPDYKQMERIFDNKTMKTWLEHNGNINDASASKKQILQTRLFYIWPTIEINGSLDMPDQLHPTPKQTEFAGLLAYPLVYNKNKLIDIIPQFPTIDNSIFENFMKKRRTCFTLADIRDEKYIGVEWNTDVVSCAISKKLTYNEGNSLNNNTLYTWILVSNSKTQFMYLFEVNPYEIATIHYCIAYLLTKEEKKEQTKILSAGEAYMENSSLQFNFQSGSIMLPLLSEYAEFLAGVKPIDSSIRWDYRSLVYPSFFIPLLTEFFHSVHIDCFYTEDSLTVNYKPTLTREYIQNVLCKHFNVQIYDDETNCKKNVNGNRVCSKQVWKPK